MPPVPYTAAEAIDREFLACRERLVSLAAALDRIQRGQGSADGNTRWEQLRRAVDLLASRDGDRAERMQMHFSLLYDPRWQIADPS